MRMLRRERDTRHALESPKTRGRALTGAGTREDERFGLSLLNLEFHVRVVAITAGTRAVLVEDATLGRGGWIQRYTDESRSRHNVWAWNMKRFGVLRESNAERRGASESDEGEGGACRLKERNCIREWEIRRNSTAMKIMCRPEGWKREGLEQEGRTNVGGGSDEQDL
jgi:hypothetical protein